MSCDGRDALLDALPRDPALHVSKGSAKRQTPNAYMSATNQIEAAVDKTAESFRDKVIRKCGESIEMKEKFFSKYAESLETMSRQMAERFQQGAKLFVMGNGGSLCDALHICVEFNHPIIEKRPAFHISLGAEDVT